MDVILVTDVIWVDFLFRQLSGAGHEVYFQELDKWYRRIIGYFQCFNFETFSRQSFHCDLTAYQAFHSRHRTIHFCQQIIVNLKFNHLQAKVSRFCIRFCDSVDFISIILQCGGDLGLLGLCTKSRAVYELTMVLKAKPT